MQLVLVHSITATSNPSFWDFDLTANIDGREMRIPFTYSGNDVHGLSTAVAQWWAENPDEPVLPFVAPPAPLATDQSITKRQLVAALIVGGGVTDPDTFIEGAIATIADPTAKALALNDWRNAPYYVRSHPLFNDPAMLGAIGMNAEAIDGLWALATTLPK